MGAFTADRAMAQTAQNRPISEAPDGAIFSPFSSTAISMQYHPYIAKFVKIEV